MKILIVDDSRSNLAVLRQYVEHFGSALCAEDDETALKLLSKATPT
jgi:CheY-like chemotaxis protein